MKKGKRIYTNLRGLKGTTLRSLSILSKILGIIIFGSGVFYLLFIKIEPSIITLPSLSPIMILSGFLLTSDELAVYKKGIQIPSPPITKFYSYDEIEYIDLNLKKRPTWKIDIKLKHGKNIELPKDKIDHLEGFYKVAENYLPKKIEVKGLK